MKNKPEKHKDKNLFKFKSFSERISEVDVRQKALYYVEHKNEDQLEENECHFHQCNRKWLTLNLSKEYTNFQNQVERIVTLPQLIHKEEFVVNLLLTSIDSATNLSLNPILEYVVALARDLREEFYKYFNSFLNKLIVLLNTQDADQTEWTLFCLAHLFKIQKPFLKNDITVVFNSIFPLLDDSKPVHVTNFAAECFSFVARDIKDKKKFLATVLKIIKNQEQNGVTGCGRLMFEIVRGVNEQFHSTAEANLTIFLESLSNQKLDRDLLFEVLTQMTTDMLEYVSIKHIDLFWKVIVNVTENVMKKFNTDKKNTEKCMEYLFHIIGQGIEYHNGISLTDPIPIINLIITVSDLDIEENLSLISSQIAAIILMSKNMNVTQLDSTRLVRKILTTNHKIVFETFIWNVVKYSQFDSFIFPEFLKYFDAYFSNNCLELMVKIISYKSPLCGDSINLNKWKQFPIKLRTNNVINEMEKYILDEDLDKLLENPDKMLLILNCLPHIIGHNFTKVSKKIQLVIEEICNQIRLEDEPLHGKEIEEFYQNKKLLFILSILVEGQIHMNTKLNMNEILDSILPYCSNFKYLQTLRLVDLIVANICKVPSNVTEEFFNKLHTILHKNFGSPYSEIRLITAHIFTNFSTIPGILPIDSKLSPYEIFFQVENIKPTVYNFRDHLQLLENLNANSKYYQTIENEETRMDCLKYTLGVLYINFKPLWEPLTNIITTFGEEIPQKNFWEIFKKHLDYSDYCINNEDELTIIPPDGYKTENQILLEQFSKCWEIKDKPDFHNYRVTLIKILSKFRSLIEKKNRDIVTFFLKFIDNEYKKSDEDFGLTTNILKIKSNGDNQDQEDVEMADDENYDNENDEHEQMDDINEKINKKKNRKKRYHDGKKGPRAVQKTLIAFLPIFTHMQCPKQIHKEPILSKLYFDLLAHRSFDVQKLSLDCIITYKHKYLTPYKEYLYNIIDEKKFKDVITQFKIDGDSKILLDEHRSQFIPFLMKILFSKMITKSKDTTTQNRKAMIFRFLCGCKKDEIFTFVQMTFDMFKNLLCDNFNETIKLVRDKFNLENLLSIKKLQSSINIIDLIREQFGGLMGNELIEYLLNILICIATIAQEVILKQNNISAFNLMAFKNLRNSCILTLTHFFEHFDTYPWNESEINAIFDVLIWPQLEKLPSDCIHRPTPLLKLLLEWSGNPRYHILFVYHHSTNSNLSVLPYFMKLFLGTHGSPSIAGCSMEIIENLFKLQSDPNKMYKHNIPTDDIKILNKISIDMERLNQIKCGENLNYGSQIMLPYISDIIKKLQRKLNNNKGKNLGKKELIILTHITELITDTQTCDQLLHLLIPILVRNANSSAGEEVMTQMIQTLTNLFQKTNKPEVYIRNISPLFQQIQATGPRKMLIELLRKTAGDREDLKLLVDIVTDLNSWNPNYIDQPNYEKRLDTMKRIGELRDAGQIDMNLCLLIVYHCFYFLKYDKDLAMRDCSSYHLKAIIPAIVIKYKEQPKELEYFIGHVILNLIRRTFKDRNENVRSEGILLLGVIARECPTAHIVLSDLNKLTNTENREEDFFDNITHLQVHRHGEALLKFCKVSKTLEIAPNPITLTQFILPLTSQYLLQERFESKQYAVNAAIETIGIICRFLPWTQYESVLQFYLKKLRFKVEFQRQLVRIVMSVLDGFHFDLSQAHVKPEDLPTLEEIEQKINEENAKNELLKINTADNDDDKEIVEKGDEDNEEEDDELDTELEKINELKENGDDDDNDDDVEMSETPKKKSKTDCAWLIPVVLTTPVAKKLVNIIQRGILPALNNAIIKLTVHDSSHKVNRKKSAEREEEEILRVPIALAIVKLLQKLPEGILEHNLPGIFMKISTFLKSPMKSVRILARDILRKIMLSVGPSCLGILLHHLTVLLTKGFQVHVLVVTIHNVLEALKNVFELGDIDKNLTNLLSVCLDDIFGKAAEEKEVEKIGIHTPEARASNKSYMILHIIAANITESCLIDLLLPFKHNLCSTQSKKVVTKVQQSLQKIISGLIENKNLSVETLLIFIYGTTSDSIPNLVAKKQKIELTDKDKEKIIRQKPDCFLIQQTPKHRTTIMINSLKTNSQSNAHVLVEFGLQLLHLIMKRGKVNDETYIGHLNPLMPMVSESLKSNYVRITTYALKCLTTLWNFKLNISAVENKIKEIVDSIFELLHKYATAEMTKNNENFQLVNNSFKAIMSLMRCVKYYEINNEQLKVLLLYVEHDLNSVDKQTIAFSVLKAIIFKKLVIPEIHVVMKKVAELSILSEIFSIREDARITFISYLMDYPLGKKIESYIKFFIKQLSYEVTTGRISAITILTSCIKKFPEEVLKQQAGLLFLSLGARLINDENPDCRIIVAKSLELLIKLLPKNNRNELFELVLVLFKDEISSHREMAAQLTIRFINVEKEEFSMRIETIFPILVSSLSIIDPDVAGKFVRKLPDNCENEILEEDEEEENGTEYNETLEIGKQRTKDHRLIQSQYAMLTLLDTCPEVFTDVNLTQYVDQLGYQSQRLLGYDHVWVRLNAVKILSQILATTDFNLIHQLYMDENLESEQLPREFLYANIHESVKSLMYDLCAQLHAGETSGEMAEEVMKNLLFIANMIKDVPFSKIEESPKNINLYTLIRKIRHIVHSEVAKCAHIIILRTAVFNFIEGLTLLLSKESLFSLAPYILQPLVREMSEDDQSVDSDLRQIALRIGKKIQQQIGVDEYNIQRNKIQTSLMLKRAERKKIVAQEKVNDPVKAAQRKTIKHVKEKIAKKRKMDVIKGKALPKKKRKTKEYNKNYESNDIF